MDSTLAVANMKNKNSALEDAYDSCTDDKVCVYETAISEGGYIKQESCNTEEEPENIHNYFGIKDEKASIYETVISVGYIKQEPFDTKDELGNVHNYVNIKDEIIEDPTIIVQETELPTNIKGNNLTRCQGCGEEYDLYCLKCPMLIRIFNSNNPNLNDNSFERTLPKNFLDICETQSGMGIVALRAIPKGVVFGPFEGLDLSKDDAVSKWKLENKELAYAKDPKWLNWMQLIRRIDQSSHPNLTPFQYEDGLYYRSDRHIGVGDELLTCWDSDGEESVTLDSCFKPPICERLDDAYACTLCCVGYKSICHLEAHNSRCPEKRDRNDFRKEIIQCAFCKIYVDKKEYSDYHLDRCCKSNGRIFPVHQEKKQSETDAFNHHPPYHSEVKPFACTQCPFKTRTKQQLKEHTVVHNDDKSFGCVQCPFKTKTNRQLKRHIATHSDDKPFACSQCPFRTKTNRQLTQHIVIHSDDKPFECFQCLFKTKTNQHLKRHMATHSDDKPFGCSQCSFKTKTYRQLTQHIATHNDDKPFACSLCPYKTRTNLELRRHVVIHSDDKPFGCILCPYKTKTNQLLKQHVVIHNDDRPYACSFCSFKATTNARLKTHAAIHKDDKPFECTQCLYKAKTSKQLKEHIVIHNDDKPFACALCSYKAKTNSQLKRHYVVHSDDKPFACTHCLYKSKTRKHLQRHIATHYDDKGTNKICTLMPRKVCGVTSKSTTKRALEVT